MNYGCTTHPILPFITITTKFPPKYCIKRVLDTEMKWWMAISVSILQKKLSYKVQTQSNQKMSNFHFDLSLKLSQGEVHDFSGEVQKFSGEVLNDLREGTHLPLYIPPLTIRSCCMYMLTQHAKQDKINSYLQIHWSDCQYQTQSSCTHHIHSQ
jgi:hypothetical protein